MTCPIKSGDILESKKPADPSGPDEGFLGQGPGHLVRPLVLLHWEARTTTSGTALTPTLLLLCGFHPHFSICEMASSPSSHSRCEDVAKAHGIPQGRAATGTHAGDLPVDLGRVLALRVGVL